MLLIVEGNTPEMRPSAAAFERELDVLTRVVRPYERALGASDYEDVDGVIFTGSGVAWGVDAPEGAVQREAMELAVRSGKPIWGSCNGMQLFAEVMGGSGGESPNGHEVPFARGVTLTPEGGHHAMMAGRAHVFDAPCIHRDEVQRLPEGAVLMASNTHSPVQAFVYERDGVCFWGTQYHPELRAADLARFVSARGIFAAHEGMAEDLAVADVDAEAAARLGVQAGALTREARMTELSNWVRFVEASR